MRISLKKVLDRVKEYGTRALIAKDYAIEPQQLIEFRAKAEAANELISDMLTLASPEEAKEIMAYLRKREEATREKAFLGGQFNPQALIEQRARELAAQMVKGGNNG